jgi:immune inhibitor A
MDLSPYAGRAVQLRFWLISDAAINGPGMQIDDVRVPEIGYADGAETGSNGWQAQGFVRTLAWLPQRWELRVVRYRPEGPQVERLELDAAGNAALQVAPGEQAVLVVSGATPFTDEPASYRYEISSP